MQTCLESLNMSPALSYIYLWNAHLSQHIYFVSNLKSPENLKPAENLWNKSFANLFAIKTYVGGIC